MNERERERNREERILHRRKIFADEKDADVVDWLKLHPVAWDRSMKLCVLYFKLSPMEMYYAMHAYSSSPVSS